MRRQRGAALLIALLAVALAAALAAGIVERGQYDVARTTAMADAERGWQYAAGTEALARAWIRRSRAPGGSALAAGEWSDPLPVPGGSVQARVIDLGGRFNVNALAHPDPARADAARRALAALLRSLNQDTDLAGEIAALLRPGPDGVRPRLAHLSELARLEHFGPGVEAAVAPRLAVFPDPGARINVNRTTPEVLAALVEGLSRESARAVLARAPFESLDELLAQPELRVVATEAVRQWFAVDSEWFLAHTRVLLDGRLREYFRLVGAAANRYDSRYVSQGIF